MADLVMWTRAFAYFALAVIVFGAVSTVVASGVSAGGADRVIAADQAPDRPFLSAAPSGTTPDSGQGAGHMAQGLCLVACFVFAWQAPDVPPAETPDDLALGLRGPPGPMYPAHQADVVPRPGPPKSLVPA